VITEIPRRPARVARLLSHFAWRSLTAIAAAGGLCLVVLVIAWLSRL
jgi:hypothetical protein